MLSLTLQCHENLAKQMLYSFSQRHSGLLKGVTCLVSGTIKEADGNELKIMSKDVLR